MTGHTFDPGHREMIAKFMHCVGTKAFAVRHTRVQIQASQLIARGPYKSYLISLNSVLSSVELL